MKFPLHKIATHHLTGLKGVEIGGSAHNSFGLDTINVDYTDDMNTPYKKAEVDLCGEALKVDVVADASSLPFDNKSYDFVITSHVLEHLWDPIRAVIEWYRVARQYIFIIVPNKLETFDKNKPLTEFQELVDRFAGDIRRPDNSPSDDHWTIWDPVTFREFCEEMAQQLNLEIVEYEEKDSKVGNGCMVLFRIR